MEREKDSQDFLIRSLGSYFQSPATLIGVGEIGRRIRGVIPPKLRALVRPNQPRREKIRKEKGSPKRDKIQEYFSSLAELPKSTTKKLRRHLEEKALFADLKTIRAALNREKERREEASPL